MLHFENANSIICKIKKEHSLRSQLRNQLKIQPMINWWLLIHGAHFSSFYLGFKMSELKMYIIICRTKRWSLIITFSKYCLLMWFLIKGREKNFQLTYEMDEKLILTFEQQIIRSVGGCGCVCDCVCVYPESVSTCLSSVGAFAACQVH